MLLECLDIIKQKNNIVKELEDNAEQSVMTPWVISLMVNNLTRYNLKHTHQDIFQYEQINEIRKLSQILKLS